MFPEILQLIPKVRISILGKLKVAVFSRFLNSVMGRLWQVP
ncbi:hypothetical protein LEP1GSC103_1650 [Leptospira borgpetersenii serovar Javanica str. UI 09931]|uniref:Uncharacterized protein n=6 Tax=Leptospira borgpetersenii TaxID=174 RepID=M3HIT0_LEPBO|nr:hypothetical protein LBBP_01535 [Leptospira borgpetersenii serovar Ballum]EKP12026.1 hypothetical protein LEP1GSC128_0220 [Leptospira borgpetersenii str. 200801926]EKQ90841.1 hypothetical protein LEP1GSC101_1234 [Leptospira borgpetersenii str. UI 09149]EKR00366.1 hypothetical protein LEP1GSC121_1229 [Leptospira borgpetersenii serovar Castellonis str. 200801910]EMF97579.1 hypothetical protein LEP1GSC123_1533 [Leptospira borgpetersenii str. 200701203]EMK09612.1 hypothetical protein LEP1GSC066